MRITLFILFAFIVTATSAQERRDSAAKLLNIAGEAWVAGDTNTVINLLTAFYQAYPDCMQSSLVCQRLGMIYNARGQTDSAFFVLYKGFETQKKWSATFKEESRLIPQLNAYTLSNAGICLLLSDMYAANRNYTKALENLQLADIKYNPYWNCVNGYEDFRASISDRMADIYLQLGDTSSAIARLVEFVLLGREPVAEKLKALLLARYTQREITREINTAIRTARAEVTTNETNKPTHAVFTIFDWQLREYAYNGKIKPIKKWVNKNWNIIYLKSRETATPTFH